MEPESPSAPATGVDLESLSGARILVVDDLKSSRMLIGSILSSAGFNNLDYAADGIEALEAIAAQQPDLLVLDLVMPRKDGYAVCREVRELYGEDLPILVQSGLQEVNQRVRAFDVGASDLVSKPVNAAELISRVRLHLERRRLIENLRRYQRRMEDELRTAEAMQFDLLRTGDEVVSIAGERGAAVQSHYQPSNRLGGDLWDIFPIDEHRFGVLMVDFSGHGVTAAINAFRLHMLIEELVEDRDKPEEWLGRLSRRLYRILPIQQFATGFYAVYDRSKHRLDFAAAGAPEPVLLRTDGSIEVLDSSGLLLGCSDAAGYEARSVDMKPGDRLVMYSDALTENFADPDESLSPEAIGEICRAIVADGAADNLCTHLISRVFDGQTVGFNDDLTIIAMETGHE